jgi:hypothetical protein
MRKAYIAGKPNGAAMKGLWCSLVVGCTAIAGLVMVLTLAGGDAGAETVYLPTPWEVTEPTTLRNGTWQVNGSVTISSGSLTLEDAELFIGGASTHPSFTLNTGARLVARRSTICGILAVTPYLYLYGDVLLDNSTVSYYYRLYTYSGTLTVDNCYMMGTYYTIYGRGSIIVHASELLAGSYAAIYWDFDTSYSGPSTRLVVEGTTIRSAGGSIYGLFIDGPDYYSCTRDAIVMGCNVSGFSYGVYVQYFTVYGTVTLTGNTCEYCSNGVYYSTLSPLVTARDNLWWPNANGVGVYISGASTSDELTVSDETVQGGERGFYASGVKNLQLRNVTTSVCNYGIYSYGSNIDVRSSNISSRTKDFYLSSSGYIHIFDTIHSYRAEVDVIGDPSYRVAEMETVSVEAVVWQSGLRIVLGMSYITNETGYAIATLDNERPRPLELPVWFVDYRGEARTPCVRGLIIDRGVRFLSLPMDIRNVSRLTLTIIDDSPPTVKVSEPSRGDMYPYDTVKVKGLCDDLGAGVYKVAVRYGDGPWVDADVSKDGTWSAVLTGLPDDVANVRVRTTRCSRASSWTRCSPR